MLESRNYLIEDVGKLANISTFYRGRSVAVTGGASFIGSHLVDVLTALGSSVLVIDDLSSGKIENLDNSISKIRFTNLDLSGSLPKGLFSDCDVVFHLAAIHGGRGFIETFGEAMLRNLVIDNSVFSRCKSDGVKRIVHASSACAYPVSLQSSSTDLRLLAEEEAGFEEQGKAFADGVYGWTKLIGEFQLQNYSSDHLSGRVARIFTAYGERENESHAAIALIAKCLLELDPLPIWGSGQQTRNFTYVSDTVTGLLLLGSDSRSNSFDVFNVGTSDHIRVIDFVEVICDLLGWHPRKFNFDTTRPEGVASRAANNQKMRECFGWTPHVEVGEGLSRTIDWYQSHSNRCQTLAELEVKLMSR